MAERFIDAAKDGYVDILREGSKRDLNTPDEDGITATLWAAHNGNLEALRLIVGREGDVDKADYMGMTALHHAAMRGHMNIVSYLVHWGCNVHALDNDLHSALDLAAMHERHEIVKFLDTDLAQRQAKNPRQVSRQKEEAMKVAENNIKRYEKLKDAAARKAEKEQKKLQKEMSQHQDGGTAPETKSKKSFIKTLTLRIKGGQNNSKSMDKLRAQPTTYSDYAGLTVTANRTGFLKKAQTKRTSPRGKPGAAEFKVTDVDSSGKRIARSLGPSHGFLGADSEVMYLTAADRGSDQAKRPALFGDVFQNNKVYKAKSESDLLDSGVNSYNDDEDDDENAPGMFNRPEFGQMMFLNTSFHNTMPSFDDAPPASVSTGMNGDAHDPLGNGDMGLDEADFSMRNQTLPWDQDDLSNLEDDDDVEDASSNEFSTVNMFLWSCGLAGYLHRFSQEMIDMPLLIAMTDAELRELGLPFGPVKKLREAIVRRKTVLEKPSQLIDTHI